MSEHLIDEAISLLMESEMTSYAIAKATGITETTIGNYRKGKTRPNAANTRILIALLSGSNHAENSGIFREDPVRRLEQPATHFTLLLPIAAQAGSLDEFIMSVRPGDCERIISPISGIDFAITVTGDSMLPEYPNGSQIFVKKINASAFIEWGKVYVLDTCNGTVVKEIHKSPDPDCVECHSVNPDPKYKPFEVNMRDIFGIYRVLMCMAVK